MPRKNAKVEGRSREERVKVRKQLGSLRSLTVQPATKKRYNLAVDKFLQFLRNENLELPRERVKLDLFTAEYLEYLWSHGEGRALASDTIAGLQDADPRLKGQLPLTWRLLKVWNTHEIPNRAPPMPEVVLQAMVGYCVFHGNTLFALSLLVAFYGMMRTGEVIGLRRTQVEIQRAQGPAVISLGLTKSGKRQGASESVTISVFEVTRRLLQWKQSSIPSLTSSAAAWRSEFARILVALGLESFQFRPYSLRRGGATFWFLKHGNLDRLLIQGRWQAPRTARIYINEGLSVLAEMNVPYHSLRGFQHIFSQSASNVLPQLERTRKASSSGGRGKVRKVMKILKCDSGMVHPSTWDWVFLGLAGNTWGYLNDLILGTSFLLGLAEDLRGNH